MTTQWIFSAIKLEEISPIPDVWMQEILYNSSILYFST